MTGQDIMSRYVWIGRRHRCCLSDAPVSNTKTVEVVFGLSWGCENNLFLFLCSFVQSVIVSWPFFYRTCLMVRCAVLLTIKVSHLKNCWEIFFLD